jgi:ABC-2 type transport system ATP-binding protein
MISVKNLTKYFGPVMAIDDVTFEVDRGEVVGFLGPNGAGKTTTMRILTSYLPATSGVARVAGYDVMTQSLDVRRNIGYLPESVPLYTEMRVEEYLTFRAKLKGVARKERQRRLDYCMDRCRIREVRRRLLGTLSKGYRQRVGLADTMIHDPPILIMDEPTAGLDPVQIRETLALIRELGQEHTVLLSTHILVEVEAVCERVIIINAGRIGFSRTLADLESQTATVLEVRGPAEQVAGTLRGVKGVLGVTVRHLEDGVSRFDVRTEEGKDLREALAEKVMQKGWTLRRLELQRRTLEEAFFAVLREENPLRDDKATTSPPSEALQDRDAQAAVTAPNE